MDGSEAVRLIRFLIQLFVRCVDTPDFPLASVFTSAHKHLTLNLRMSCQFDDFMLSRYEFRRNSYISDVYHLAEVQ